MKHARKQQGGAQHVHRQGTQNGNVNNNGAPAMSARQRNAAQRMAILQSAVDMIQLQQSTTLTAPNLANPNVVNFVPKNVGLLKRFYVECNVSFTTAAGTSACALSTFGPANILSNITFIDYQNQNRIATTGWHLVGVNTLRAPVQAPLGSAEVTDTPLGYGNNYSAIAAPATVAASTTATVKMVFEVPIAYSDMDLRGAIYMATTGANATLQLTLNQNFFVLNTADATNAVYAYAGTVPTINSVTFNIYQNYLDQLPLSGGKVIVPENDLNTVYQLIYTNFSGFTVNNIFGVPYTNLRSFYSTMIVYDNGGTLNAGTDITSIGLQAANNTFIFQMDPQLISYRTRKIINADYPKGSYMFDHKRAPIATDQFGNLQLAILASVVNANAVVYLGYEFFATRSTIINAASLPSG